LLIANIFSQVLLLICRAGRYIITDIRFQHMKHNDGETPTY